MDLSEVTDMALSLLTAERDRLGDEHGIYEPEQRSYSGVCQGIVRIGVIHVVPIVVPFGQMVVPIVVPIDQRVVPSKR